MKMLGGKMTGILTVVLAIAGGIPSCQVAITPTLHHQELKEAPLVAVIPSSDNPVFARALDGFIQSTEARVAVYPSLEEASPQQIATAFEIEKPDLIFALGTKATLVARDLWPEIPVLFSMVVNHGRHKLAEQPNVMGVALETAPAVEFMMFKMVMPNLRKVVAIHSPEASQRLVDAAIASIKPLGIELVAIPVATGEDVPQAFAKIPEDAQAIWYLNDPVVMNQASFTYLRDASKKAKLPFVCSFSNRFAEAGALMSVSVDLTSLGSQASAMARQYFNGTSTEKVGIQPPIGSTLVVNLDTAREIGLEVPSEVLPFINELIDTQQSSDDESSRLSWP